MIRSRRSLFVTLAVFLSMIIAGSSLSRAQHIRWSVIDGDPAKNPDVGVAVVWGTRAARDIGINFLRRASVANARFVGTAGEVSLLGQVQDQQIRLLTLPMAQLNQSPGWVALDLQPNLSILSAALYREFLVVEGKSDPLHIDPLSERSVRLRNFAFFKLLVHRGNDARADTVIRPVGQTLEIVLLADPVTLNGNALLVRVLFRGKPLAGVRIFAATSSARDSSSAVSDAEGKALLSMVSLGTWVVWVNQIVQASGEADVEVYGSTLTLRRG